MPYTSVNGHMFSFLFKEKIIGVRLSKKDREEFITNYNSKLMQQYGRIMKEYVEVPKEIINDTNILSIYLQKSYEYVSKLKPKK